MHNIAILSFILVVFLIFDDIFNEIYVFYQRYIDKKGENR